MSSGRSQNYDGGVAQRRTPKSRAQKRSVVLEAVRPTREVPSIGRYTARLYDEQGRKKT